MLPNNYYKLPLLSVLYFLITCAEPVASKLPDGPQIPAIDDSSMISIITWNIEQFDESVTANTLDRVQLIMDSLDADFYCLQEIETKSPLINLVSELDRYSVIISDDTRYDHLAIVYKQDLFLPIITQSLFANDDYNYAGRPPLLINFAYISEGQEHYLNLINLHMKCCESEPSDLERRHDASQMLYDYLHQMHAWGDSNFVVVGDWNDDIHDTDGSGQYAFQAFLDDPGNYKFVTDSLAATQSVNNATFPSWNSFLDNILISKSLFDENRSSEVRTLRLDEIFGDYSSVVSDHRPVMWSFEPK